MTRAVRAVLFDVDGTLYHESVLRNCMRVELATLPLVKMSYRSAYSVWRSLTHFRRVREELRDRGESQSSLATLQYVEAARRTGQDPTQIERMVMDWIHQRPLKYIRACRRRGLEQFLTFLEARGIRAGVFSDYPVSAKLRALGLSSRMSLALCATDPSINAFKPHPKGFLHACVLWGLTPAEVLYVGDRPDVDAVGAAAAGMSCALLGGKRHGTSKAAAVGSVRVSSFEGLQALLTP